MKKEQKRKEAIERLEREPRGYLPGTPTVAEVWAKRKAEAKRLREQFGVR